MNPEIEIEKYDLTVFGATGVTGEYVVKELIKFPIKIKWSIAGRDYQKLKALVDSYRTPISRYTELGPRLDAIDILVVDVSDEMSLERMCKKTKVLINCVGPYRFFGEQVVRNCIKSKTHCVDVSGEPQFLEAMQVKYFEEAKKQNVYIVGSCGFDSIPCDLGIDYLKKNFRGDLDSVETYALLKRPPFSTVNFATWQSAIHSLYHANELKPLRKELKEKLFTKSIPKPSYPLKKRFVLFKSQEAHGWCIPFIGSDRSVALRTQMYNYQFRNEKPIQIQTYMKMYTFFYAVISLLVGAVFMILTKFSLGCTLLEMFPEVFSLGTFSRKPQTHDNLHLAGFKIIFVGNGWSETLLEPSDKHVEPPNKKVKAVMSGPEPGYVTTAICVVNAAVVILRELDRLPPDGGVFTPAAAFANTHLLERLDARGITIAIK